MKITNIEILNYRLLHKESINLEDDITLIVGRNNSGKSSLADLFIDLLEKKKTNLKFFDFSDQSYSKFKTSFMYYKEYKESVIQNEDEKIQIEKKKKFEDVMPKIEFKITIEYDKDEKNEEGEIVKEGDNLTALSKFIMDLDIDRNEAYICLEYSSDNTQKLFKEYVEYLAEKKTSSDDDKLLLKFLENNVKEYYSLKIFKVDKNKQEFKQLIESRTMLDDVFLTRSIVAQRNLDDNTSDSKKALGGGFERYYKHTRLGDDKKQEIKDALETVSGKLETEYGSLFNKVITDLQNFGAETPAKIPKITIKSILDSEKVLKDNIKYFYKNNEDIHFPENYNGLGYSNLIFMLLQFASFFEEFKNSTPKPNFLFLILEEPEAHMHPQMQQVFIKSVNDFLEKKGECVQIIITTHSSHILSESGIDDIKGFNRIRYFDNAENKLIVRDMSRFEIKADKVATTKFLKQYLTLHKCDLFFADKVILVEGTTERMLLPLMIKKVSKSLQHQYISIIEVGGAYAQKFKDLLEFLNLKALIITDLDTIDSSRNKCCVKLGDKTCNPTLKTWIPKKEKISDLLTETEDNKISGKIKVSYQIPEPGCDHCGRSFEEALILKNSTYFKENKLEIKLLKKSENEDILNPEKAYELSPNDSKIKTEFAFDLIVLNEWEVPQYIINGLEWLETDTLK